jgi:hypothetical protein
LGSSKPPKRFDVHLILDSYGTNKHPWFTVGLVRRSGFHSYFTPTSTSWINRVERRLALLTEKRLRRAGRRSTVMLRPPPAPLWG